MQKENRQIDELTAAEINEAEILWIKGIQSQIKTTGNFKLFAVQLGIVEKENLLEQNF